jgi:hypothetical protein
VVITSFILSLRVIARAASDAAEIHGIPYFTSANNLGRMSWEGKYKAFEGEPCLEGAISCHDFGNGLGYKQRIKWTNGLGVLSFQWSEPFYSFNGPPGSSSNIDVYLLDPETGEVTGFPPANNIGDDPIELVFLEDNIEYDLVIALTEGSAPEMMKWSIVLKTTEEGTIEANPPANAGTISNHANNDYVAAVGAAFELQTFSELKAETFSSAGGTPILFNRNGKRLRKPKVFNQPRFVGPDVSLDGPHQTSRSTMSSALSRSLVCSLPTSTCPPYID